MTEKYKIKLGDLEKRGEINKLERDGFSREKIIKEMYKLTDGASQQYRTKIINELYDRNAK